MAGGVGAKRLSALTPLAGCAECLPGTLAETRLPNNDVTLFDQSYVAAALFKSAAAGAILEGSSFPWSSNGLKQQTQWRLLTVGIGADHYEARAVKIGDWTGARLALDEFFTDVRKLVEVDLAVGSLLYADGEACVFSFPGERFGHDKQGYQGGDLQTGVWENRLTEQIYRCAREANLETPPYCHISEKPSRSLVGMTAEIRKARETMAVPLHRNWQIPGQDSSNGHVCPVCLVRRNRSGTDKQMPCDPCKARRTHRLGMWLEGKFGSDSIWISEVADSNDRVGLVTMSLDIESWLDGTRLDALRTQAIPEWRKFNPVLKNQSNPIDPHACFGSLFQHVKGKLASFDKTDPVLSSLQEGYQYETDWPSFFFKIVEDRTNAPQWDVLDEDGRARWLTHQLFRKLASPGRIYRFERQAEEFFKDLLNDFRKKAPAGENPNPWRNRRLLLKPYKLSPAWINREPYNGRVDGNALDLLFSKELGGFITIFNLGRILETSESKDRLKGKPPIPLKDDDNKPVDPLTVEAVDEMPGSLGVYDPVIPLELSPVRFRVLLPLEAVSDCVDLAVEKWNKQFARVWDRLPLRVGVVAFPKMTPFQAVIEAARTVEEDLDRIRKPETWRVVGCETQDGAAAPNLATPGSGTMHELHTIPVTLPDGREDVFYPYLAVEDEQVRFSLDFQHPDGQIYRHVKNLRSGDGILVYPSFIATMFLDSTARRFEPAEKWKHRLSEWRRMRDLWGLMDRAVPSQTALRGAWSELVARREAWQGPDGTWLEGGEEVWLDLARVVFHERLDVRGACLETLVQAAQDDVLDWCLEWHMSVIKKHVSGGDR